MSEIPFIQFYPGDYFKDTNLLSTEQHGAYLLLLFNAWGRKDCKLPNNDEMLARATRLSVRKWKAMKPVIMEFFEEKDGVIFNKRLLSEHQSATEKRKERQASGSAGGKAKSLKTKDATSSTAKDLPVAKGKQTSGISEPDSEPDIEKETPCSPPKGEATDLFDGKDKLDTLKTKPKKKRAIAIPDGFPDADAVRRASEYFQKNGKSDIDASKEAEKFRDFKLADGKTHKDWSAAWRTWCRNAVDFAGKRNATPGVSHGTSRHVDPDQWRTRVRNFHGEALWNTEWGPKPDDPGCRAPQEVLEHFNETRRETA